MRRTPGVFPSGLFSITLETYLYAALLEYFLLDFSLYVLISDRFEVAFANIKFSVVKIEKRCI